MRLFLLACLGLSLAAAAREMWCVPDNCKIDSNCEDSIHPFIGGRCCGGKCVRESDVSSRKRLIGERCAPRDLAHPDNFEQCFAECATGLFCNTVDEICHAKRGVNCSCLADRECLSNNCRDSHVCGGTNLAFGETCEANSECASGICENNKCSAYAIGESCSSSSQCVPSAICRRNSTSFFTYCLSPCAVGEGNCCFVSGSSACATTPANLECFLGNYSCYVPPPTPPVVVPDLDEPCTFACRNYTTMVCAYPCNATTGCETQRVCQLKNQVQIGDECDGGASNGQCVVGASCSYDFSVFMYLCTALPTSAPTGAPTPRVLNSVPLGQPCGGPLDYDLCQAPGNMCEENQTGYYVCKQSGATPIGAFCSLSSRSRDVHALDECVQGSRCTRNDTFGFGSSYCAPRIPIGQRCYSTSSYRDYSYPECENGWDSCAVTGRSGCGGSCYGNDNNGNPCCTCVVPRSVPDGKNCSATKECQRATSVCFTENRTCGNMQGVDCLTASDCRDGSFDCSCDRKCYVLNAPTPSVVSLAPTASTRAPSPYPPSRCATQEAAWEQMVLNMSFSFTSWSGFPYTLTYANFHNNFVPQLLKLTESEQATAIAYVCCYSCVQNERFNSQIYKGYQVDCAARRLIKLEDTCNDLRGHLGMANCWGAVSAASTLDMRLGFILATFLAASL